MDINPGDRAADCGGMMEPIKTEEKSGDFDIVHQCQKCGHKKKNKIAFNDNFEEIIKISKNIIEC